MLDDLRTDRDKALDASQIKRDDFNHARESHAGLRQLAHATLNPLRSSDAEKKALKALKDPYRRVKRVNGAYPKGSSYVSEKLDEALVWLSCHRSELPTEIEREDGRLNSARREHNEASYGMEIADIDNPNQSDYEAAGQLYVGDRACYASLEATLNSIAEASPSVAEHYGAYGMTPKLHAIAMAVRGERLRKRMEARAAKLRWRGMQAYDAMPKGFAKQAEGVTRPKVKSNAKPLPPVAELMALFHVEGDQLIRTKLGKPIVSDRVKVGTKTYVTSRVAYAVSNGVDPEDKVVRNGDAVEYRNASGYTYERPDGLWTAQVRLPEGAVTIGTYDTEEIAREACGIYLKALTF